MENQGKLLETIRQRYSCRNYLNDPIQPETLDGLEIFMQTLRPGPFGHQTRFKLAAATENERSSLRGLGTYGFIRGATGFIIGAIRVPDQNEDAPYYLEDFGYQMEQVILQATALGLGTCWLGGTFTKSSFAKKINLKDGELIPCVTSTGYPSGKKRLVESIVRRKARAERRRPWERLFFDGDFNHPLKPHDAGDYAIPVEMVHIGPSASNKQPWRIVQDRDRYHFYLQRTAGYREGMLVRLVTVADLQRIDMGIAMCHFELSARTLGLQGEWLHQDPKLEMPGEGMHYTVSWVIKGGI